MAPTILREGAFRLFFFSREESRIHVHINHPNGEAKFLLTPHVHIASAAGLSEKQIKEAQKIVDNNFQEIQDAWHKHFGG